MFGDEVGVDGLFVVGGVGVAFPGVHGEAAGGEFEFVDGLAEAAVGDAVLGAEFDEDTGMEEFDEEHGEGRVFGPAGFLVEAAGKAGQELGSKRVEGGRHEDSLHDRKKRKLKRKIESERTLTATEKTGLLWMAGPARCRRYQS